MQGTVKQNKGREILVERGQEVLASPCVALPLPPHAPEVQACIEREEPRPESYPWSPPSLQSQAASNASKSGNTHDLYQGIPMTIRVMFPRQLSRGARKQMYGD